MSKPHNHVENCGHAGEEFADLVDLGQQFLDLSDDAALFGKRNDRDLLLIQLVSIDTWYRG